MEKVLFNNLQIKSSSAEDGHFSGYASVYHEADLHQDVILPGAFNESTQDPGSIKLLWQHDPSTPIGVLTKIVETDNGLYVEGKILLATVKGAEAFELLKAGAINGLSIGFEVEEYFTEKEYRYIVRGKLWEISIVTFPANHKARVRAFKQEEESDVNRNLLREINRAIALMHMVIQEVKSTRRVIHKGNYRVH